jgi:hypothetical protein
MACTLRKPPSPTYVGTKPSHPPTATPPTPAGCLRIAMQEGAALQGCQMVYFQTKNPNLGKYWRALEWDMLGYFMPVWTTVLPYDINYGHLQILW